MLPDWPRTRLPLQDLGEVDARWRGILSPRYDDATIARYLQRQFLEEAEQYAKDYAQDEYWRLLVRDARRHLPPTAARARRILDIGSGAGNTIFALLELFSDAAIVASDLSLPLLASLARQRAARYAGRDCLVVQLNAEDRLFEDSQFDLVVGGAVLHHLLEPRRAIENASAALVDDGAAVFYEPFEAGNQILTLAFRSLRHMNERPPGSAIPEDVMAFLEGYRCDLQVRKGEDKSSEVFLGLDDKWIFTRSFFERVGLEAGFRGVTIYPLHLVDGMCEHQLGVLLRLRFGYEISKVMPPWALEYLREVDQHFSPELRREFLIEGAIILRK